MLSLLIGGLVAVACYRALGASWKAMGIIAGLVVVMNLLAWWAQPLTVPVFVAGFIAVNLVFLADKGGFFRATG